MGRGGAPNGMKTHNQHGTATVREPASSTERLLISKQVQASRRNGPEMVV
jgi:hypothetical protein